VTFVIKPTADGYVWENSSGANDYSIHSSYQDGTLHEVGDRIIPGKEQSASLI